MFKKLKCLIFGHKYALALSDKDSEIELLNDESNILFGDLDLYACINCGKVISKFTEEK